MSGAKVDVLVRLEELRQAVGEDPEGDRAVQSIIDDVAELIERDRAATKVFDCILRGLSDLTGTMGHRSQPFVVGWLENWAKSMHVAGFKPTDPSARDIARALARITSP